jgi:cytoskeletal protein CcmA (bactofilin family)
MWNRNKKEEDLPQRPTFAPTPAEPAREAIPMATYPTKTAEFGSTRGAAVLGRSLVITGRVTGKEDLVIDGRVDGDIELPENRLTVGASGHVQGGIRAREIVVLGTVHGNLEASERVEIKKNARVLGDLKAQRPVIEDEAYFKGNVETIRVDKPKPAPAPVPEVANAAAAGQTTASQAGGRPAQATLPTVETKPETRP